VNLEPISQSSLVDRVAERIRLVIDQGHFQAGDRLPTESELSEQLQVSRSVLREAVSRLETLGVLTVRRGRGMYVGDRGSLSTCVQLVKSAMTISPKELVHFEELRRGIEIQAARVAAQRAGPEAVAELEALCEQMDREGVEYLESVRIDCEFHRQLVASTGNELMKNVMEVIHEFIFAGMVQTTPKPRNRTRSRQYHRPIVDAIRARDPDAAEKAMKVHMDSVDRAVREIEARQKQN
jgi:GntR family transcriptional repressor for pyruvate dehydrogenase complex